jgi:hypothetical protein
VYVCARISKLSNVKKETAATILASDVSATTGFVRFKICICNGVVSRDSYIVKHEAGNGNDP